MRVGGESGEWNDVSGSSGTCPKKSAPRASVYFLGGGLRPMIEIEPTDHPLAVDQREGISRAKAWEIVHHYAERSDDAPVHGDVLGSAAQSDPAAIANPRQITCGVHVARRRAMAPFSLLTRARPAWLALALVACGSRTGLASLDAVDDAGPVADGGVDDGFPVGTFSSCATGIASDDSNDFLNVAGFEAGAHLTVSRDGSTVTAAFVDESGHHDDFTFEVVAPTVASLSSSGQVAKGFPSLCVLGPGDEIPADADLDLDGGALTYDAGTILLSVQGVLHDAEPGKCGVRSTPAKLWITCARDALGSPSPSSTLGAPASAPFPVGAYACRSEVDTHAVESGIDENVGAGEKGTLTLSQSGSALTARYEGDRYVSGTANFVVTSATTARIDDAQVLAAPCMVPIDVTGGSSGEASNETLSIAAALLRTDGATLVLSFAGSMTSSGASPTTCPGAQKAGALVCTKS